MHIMIMAQCYAPEDVSAAVLITELATDLVRNGHCVTIVTGAPNYPHGRVFDGYRNRFYSTEILDGVRIIRTWSYITPSRKFWSRLLHYGTYSVSAFYGGLFAGRPDVLVSFSPPLPLGLSAWLLGRLWHVPWVLQIEDLFPDAAVAAGMLKKKWVIRLFSGLERFLYQRATHISIISESFRENLLAKNVPASKLELIPVWADPDVVHPLPKQNAFRHDLGLDDKFMILYAGNMGLTSCLEDILDAAQILQGQSDIQFVLVGEGVRKDTLKSAAHKKKLNNIRFLPYQSRERFPEMLASADVGLVTLATDASTSSLPSKVFNIMSSARPVLSIAPSESELAVIIRNARCGWNIPPACPTILADTILKLKEQEDDREKMGQRGRAHLECHYARKQCVAAYENMLMSLLGQPHSSRKLEIMR